MNVILYNAISVDGFISGVGDNVDWVTETDWDQFTTLVKESKCIVMGRRTFEQSGDDFPYECELNIVMTSHPDDHTQSDSVLFTNATPQEVIALAEDEGFETLLIIGGGLLNNSFLEAHLINEVYLDVHPKILGEGIKLFESEGTDIDLELLDAQELDEGLMLLHYKVEY